MKKPLLFLIPAALGLGSIGNAATFNITSDLGDYQIRDGVADTGRAGSVTYSSGFDNNAVFVFELPDIGSASISTANLDFHANIAGSPTHNVDLWGIGFESSTTPLIEFFNADTGDAGNTKIQDNILTSSIGGAGVYSTDAGGDTILASYLQSFYDANPTYTGGSYVFLRLNGDAAGVDNSNRFTQILYRDNTLDPANVPLGIHPELTITTIPEPSTYAIGFGVLAVGIAALRRRK